MNIRRRQSKKERRKIQANIGKQNKNGVSKKLEFSYYLKKLINICLVIVALFGLYPIVHPDVIITPSSTLTNRDPFRTKWIITNTGWGSVISLQVALRPHQINTSGSKIIGPKDFSGKIIFDSGNIGVLGPGEGTTFEIPIIIGDSVTITETDIAFSLEYQAKYFPFLTWKKIQRFIPSPHKDGTWEWFPYKQT